MGSIIQLEAVPNQSLSVDLDEVRYQLRFRDLGELMAVDLSINDVVILQGARVVDNTPLIPYQYLRANNTTANFYFLTEQNTIPFYTDFGFTTFLYYTL